MEHRRRFTRSRALVEAGEVGFERLGGEAEEGLVGGEFGVLGEFALEFGWKFDILSGKEGDEIMGGWKGLMGRESEVQER